MFKAIVDLRLSFVAVAAALALVAPVSGALAADATVDFSITNGNPNGVWSYGSSSTLGVTFTNFVTSTVDPFMPGLDVWQATGGDGLPWVGKAGPGGWTYSTVTVAANTLTMHPGAGIEQFSVFRFTAASAGIYQFNGAFWGQDSTSTDVYVQNGATALFSSAVNGFGNTQNFNGAVALGAGGTLDFAVGRGNGNYVFDSTGLSATVTVVPEPGAAALLLAGLATVAMVARRRRLQA